MAVSAVVRGWSGVGVPPVVWILVQQGAGELVYVSCEQGGPPWGPLIALVGAAVCAFLAWMAWSGRETDGTPVDSFLCRAGAGMGAIFTLGCLVVAASTFIVAPPCAR